MEAMYQVEGPVYQVESGIQVPLPRKAVTEKFPFQRMRIGDSFLIRKNGAGKVMMERLRSHALIHAKALNVKVTTRKVRGGIRVWKVEGGK